MCVWYIERTVVTERKILTPFGCFTHLSLHSQCLCLHGCMCECKREREYKHKPTFMQSFFNFISHLFVMMVQVQAELSSYTVYSIQILMQYQFRDAEVEWTVTVSPGTPTPVQESSYASGQHSSLSSSLVMDSPGSLTSPPIRYAALEF